MWRLTQKRKENLVKLCLSIFTVDAAGLIAPMLLRAGGFHAMLFWGAWLLAIWMALMIYLLEA